MSELVVAPSRNRQAARLAWADRLARHATSSLSVAAFCASEGVGTSSFFYWKRQFASAASSGPACAEPRLLSVHVHPASAPVEVVLPGGVSLRLAPGCDLAFVRSLVEALGSPSC